ncbi:MAG: hypothetical protein WD847_10395 [Pirellulales bacterium]
MTAGELATLWTIRAALACYFAALIAQTAGRRESSQSLGRLFWTAGCLVYLAHVACAFHYYHGWSHGTAWRHTAGVTQQVIGWHWGGGLFVNYLFSAVWLGDVAWWWIRPAGRRARPAAVSLAVHGFMLFVVVNATVVFETGALRWLALAACLLLAACWLARRRRAATNDQ